MRGLDADEYAALKQAARGEGDSDDVVLMRRLVDRGSLTWPAEVPGQSRRVIYITAAGRLALLCHEIASRTFDV